jgi:hypothetical protein
VISKIARDAVLGRFRRAWLSKLNAALPDYPEVSDTDKSQLQAIDWGGSSRKQVFRGQINVDSLENSSAISWPLVIVYSSDLNHDGVEKFVTFSGSSVVNLEFHFTWLKGAALPNFDETMDLIEDSVIRVLHDKAWVGALDSGLSYRGEISSQRGQVQDGGKHWVQAVSFRATFGVDI